MVLVILYEVAIYHIGLITGDYYKILTSDIDNNKEAFLKQTVKSVALIFTISLLKSIKDYVASYLYVAWRKLLTSQLHENYFKNWSFLRLNVSNIYNNGYIINSKIKVDNVDQRITQDIDKMFQMLSIMIPELLVSPFIITFYWYKCQQVSGFVGPIGCLALFIFGTSINYFLIQKVSHYVYSQEKCEGDFRFQHLRIRNNAETIAFISGESMEKRKCDDLLKALISTQKCLILQQFFLKFTTNLSDYFGSIISFIAISIPLFAHKYNHLSPKDLAKLISNNAFFTMYLINCFTRLIDLSTNFSTFLGNYRRVIELNQWFQSNKPSLEDSELYIDNNLSHRPNFDYQNDLCFFELKNVNIKTPFNRSVVENLNLTIKSGINLLITGPSGVGKTSILRSIKDIWPIAGGKIKRNISLNIPNFAMFLSHNPILTNGTVAEQILYPNVYEREKWLNNDGFHRIVIDILKFLDLESCVLKRVDYDLHCDLKINWIDQLSAGEVQRFNLARVFYHRPLVLFLDETTSALPEEMEAKIIQELINKQMTIISCGHRESLKRFHQMELRIENNQQFELIDLKKRIL